MYVTRPVGVFPSPHGLSEQQAMLSSRESHRDFSELLLRIQMGEHIRHSLAKAFSGMQFNLSVMGASSLLRKCYVPSF
jgi:hypothetical protein